MRWIRRALYVLGVLGFSNLAAAACMVPHMVSANGAAGLLLGLASLVLLGCALFRPLGRAVFPARSIRMLAGGVELLRLFLVTATINAVSVLGFLLAVSPWAGADGYERGVGALICGVHVLLVVAVEAVVFGTA